MIRALRSASTGMNAQQLNLDNISNNLANVNTTGFKKGQIQFQDLMYQVIKPAGASLQQNSVEPVQLEIGHGVRPIAITRSFEQGSLTQTDNPLDLAIAGDGFFQVRLPSGAVAYTRDGNLEISPDGTICTANGYPLEPDLRIPPDAQEIVISNQGIVSVNIQGETQPEEIGQLELARFINPAGLASIGQNLLEETVASGQPIRNEPGQEGLGTIEQGYLEASNVSVIEEMVQMIMAQRSYEINSKSIRAAEDMLAQAVNLKR
ncbi:MAG TPA: flagellar basal-body rod protein FlgG [bacterium]|jgi:flagellar basal-body rod protein FlgG